MSAACEFWTSGATSLTATLAAEFGLYRHDEHMARPGFYRVITGLHEFGFPSFNAVVDDFGNLVAVQ
jgi:hypothetical protein